MFRNSLLLLAIFAAPVMADDWPQWFGPQRDGVWRETGIVDKFPEGGPKVLLANADRPGLPPAPRSPAARSTSPIAFSRRGSRIPKIRST